MNKKIAILVFVVIGLTGAIIIIFTVALRKSEYTNQINNTDQKEGINRDGMDKAPRQVTAHFGNDASSEIITMITILFKGT